MGLAEQFCQKWQLKPLGDDLYQIIDTGSSTAVQVSGCSTANGGHVVAYPVDRSDCQAWRIEPAKRQLHDHSGEDREGDGRAWV